MEREIQALKLNNTWEIVDLPPGHKPIGCKWVFKIKRKPDESIYKYKARLVAKGYNQTEGLDYFDSFHQLQTFFKAIKYGFKQSYHDSCLFVYKTTDVFMILIIYVDDILITGTLEEEMLAVKKFLHDQFTIKNLGVVKFFLGIEIARSHSVYAKSNTNHWKAAQHVVKYLVGTKEHGMFYAAQNDMKQAIIERSSSEAGYRSAH
ncbi:hypothetical protein LIER_33556 [Lithospermum erythrorhizon]|uniref:Reverse transcriptase Ty1/copia-type domain-containing protein n=1 Tax=Lithospermum erythrorhizon TaxID=34254 RepID=A0AAV3RX18_LITER